MKASSLEQGCPDYMTFKNHKTHYSLHQQDMNYNCRDTKMLIESTNFQKPRHRATIYQPTAILTRAS